MLNTAHESLYFTTNASEFLGYPPLTLVVCDYYPGGGFAGSPEVLTLCRTVDLAAHETARPAEFPPPSAGIEYRIGGCSFRNYVYRTR